MRTTERLFPGMGQHVSLEMSSSGARVIALCATESLPTTVKQHIRFQIICHFERVDYFLFQTLLEFFSHFDFDFLQFIFSFLWCVADDLSCSAL